MMKTDEDDILEEQHRSSKSSQLQTELLVHERQMKIMAIHNKTLHSQYKLQEETIKSLLESQHKLEAEHSLISSVELNESGSSTADIILSTQNYHLFPTSIVKVTDEPSLTFSYNIKRLPATMFFCPVHSLFHLLLSITQLCSHLAYAFK